MESKDLYIQCEYQETPLGIDVLHPRFSWQICSEEIVEQQGYRVIVSSSQEMNEADIGDMWDSQWVPAQKSSSVEYDGKRLCSRGIYYWKVLLDTGEGGILRSKTGTFEMGLLKESDWEASWVGNPASNCGGSLLFRKLFSISKKLAKARVYLCGLGLFELYVNGLKIGDHVLDPAWTEYQKRVLYVTFDIGDYLKTGDNVIGVFLGNGWYGANALLCQIGLYFADGSKEILYPGCHTSQWLVCAGPVVHNSIYNGEVYDARLEKPGWNTPEYDINQKYPQGYGWTAPYYIEGPAGHKEAQAMEAIKRIEYKKPLKVEKKPSGVYIVDMGQNMAGWVQLRVKGASPGTEICMRFAEVLYDDGMVNQENLRTAMARDIYIAAGKEEEVYEPRFTYHGFRYIQIEGYPGTLEEDSITGCIVRSSVERIGYFQSSDMLVNQIYANALWTENANLYGLPTDCPQRDERQGWLNDMTVRAEGSMYTFNMSRFLPKWVKDIADTQDALGAIADTAPFKWGFRPADPVSSCYLLIPWLLYLQYGDKKCVEEHYEGLKQWQEYLQTRSQQGIVTYSYYGDWAGPVSENVSAGLGDGAVSKTTPGILMSTGYFYMNAVLLQKMAEVLGNQEDLQYYTQMSQNIKQAFHKTFYDEEKGYYGSGSQAANAFALYLKVVPENCRQLVLQHLAEDIEKRGFHLSTGNLGTKYVLEVLAEAGMEDLAMKLVKQTTYPSWGYMISKGATTIWERWEYAAGGEMNSHNHPMLDSVSGWFYKYLAGIRLCESDPGFQTCVFKPYFPKDLDWIEASLKTIKGRVALSWKKQRQAIELKLLVPCTSKGRLSLPKMYQEMKLQSVTVNGSCVWEKGKQENPVSYVWDIEEIQDRIIFHTHSGEINFILHLVDRRWGN